MTSINTKLAVSRKRPGPSPVSDSAGAASFVTPERRQQLIAHAAYLRAEQRGFAPGHELEDWCGAERDIDLQLTGADASTQPGA